MKKFLLETLKLTIASAVAFYLIFSLCCWTQVQMDNFRIQREYYAQQEAAMCIAIARALHELSNEYLNNTTHQP